MIFTSFFKALGQIGDPSFRKVLFLGIGLTIALLIAASAAMMWLLQEVVGDTTTLPLIGEVHWLGDLLSWSGLALMVILSMFLMVPVASAITSMFLDEVAQAVEERHYPHKVAARKASVWDDVRDTVNFLGVLIGANLLAFIAYGAFPFASLFIFWALNGFLLGREYFQLAAMRHVGRENAKVLRRQHRFVIWMAGILMAIPLSVPIMNLIIPILGAATFTHMFHALSARRTV